MGRRGILGRAGSRLALGLCAGALTLAGVLVPEIASGAKPITRLPSREPVSARSAPAAACSDATVLAKWPNDRLALAVIAVPVAETSLSEVLTEVKGGVGGVLLFGSSAPSNLGKQVALLDKDSPGRLGVLVMTDEEGGGVQRMANLVGSLPWAAWMGSHWSAAQIETAVTAVARKMAKYGVGMDLAPVVDVDGRDVPPSASDPDGWRSLSGKTAVAARDGLAYMRGLVAGGVIPVLKHFPGLGGASGNTDVEPARTLPWATLQKAALPPFTQAIKAGAPAVMVSNATVPGLASYPASLSPAVISHELVGRLGFHGLVVTDSLTAEAITAAGFSLPQAVVQALRAGADLTLFGPTSAPATTASDTAAIERAVLGALSDGQLSRGRLVAAAAAVLVARHVDLCPRAGQ